MDPKELDYFKELLNKELEELTQRGYQAVIDLRDQNNYFSDLVDKATIEADRNFQLRIKDRESRLIRKIKEALERTKDGSYGICESCGEEISIGRLKVRPVAVHCIHCKTKAEADEKAYQE